MSKQATDQAVSNLRVQKAAVESNSANVHRLEDLQSFEKVYAPFDDVITVRSTDIGAPINAGASTPAQELFHMTSIAKLRLFVAVPEVYSRAAQNGATASLTLDEFPGERFTGTLVRNANAIDPASRTLNTEVDVDNPTGRLLPGACVSVHLKLPEVVRSVTITSWLTPNQSESLKTQWRILADSPIYAASAANGRPGSPDRNRAITRPICSDATQDFIRGITTPRSCLESPT